MRIKFLPVAVAAVLLAALLGVSAACAQEPQPGGACDTAGHFTRAGGVEIPGGHFMVCDGANWISFLDYNDAGQVLFQLHNDAESCTAAKDGRIRYNSAASPPWAYCDGGATTWRPFEQPQCQDDGTGECYLSVTRSDNDPDFTAANIKDSTTILGVTGTAAGGGGGDLWTELSKETASDAADGDQFGISVAIDGDAAVIGAYGEDGAGSDRGAVYVFERASNGSWSEAQKLTASDSADGDQFGISVAIDGDAAVIGASYEDGAGSDRGAVYVFERAGNGSWAQVQKLTASDAEDGDNFGGNVAIDGDTAVIGAASEDGAGSNHGAVYVFERASNGSWAQVQKLTASDPENNDLFGDSVAVDGDAIVTGASGEDGAGSNRGAVYVFERASNGNWAQVQKLTASDPADSDWFGNSVAVDGDIALVGAEQEDGAGTDRGAVYVFERASDGSWTQIQKLTASDAADSDWFGSSVAIDGDTAVIGARSEDGAGTNRGSAYAFSRNSSGVWMQTQKLTAGDAADNDNFGTGVAVDGDTTVIGSLSDGAGTDRGAAYFFYEN